MRILKFQSETWELFYHYFDFSDADEENFDILRWWSQKTQTYPILSIMTKDLEAQRLLNYADEENFDILILEEMHWMRDVIV